MSVCLRRRGAYRRAVDLRLHLNLARLCRFVVRDGFIRSHSPVHAIRELTPVHRCLTFGGGGKHLRADKQHTGRHNYRYGMHVLNPSRKCAAGKYDEVPILTPSRDAGSMIRRENMGLGRIAAPTPSNRRAEPKLRHTPVIAPRAPEQGSRYKVQLRDDRPQYNPRE